MKEERRATAEAWLVANGVAGILSNETRTEIVEKLMTDRTLFDEHYDSRLHGKSINDLFNDQSFCGYFGETKRLLQEEDLRFLTERGSTFRVDGRNRPVLGWNNGGNPKLITMQECRDELGFESVILWQNEEMVNTTYVEDLLQSSVDRLGLPRRLHRRIASGPNGFEHVEREEDGLELHKVFLTFSFDVVEAIANDRLLVVP